MKIVRRGFVIIILAICFPIFTFAQDNCIDFDGFDDHVSLGDINQLDDVSEFTIEIWVYFNQHTNFATIFEQREDGFKNITIQAGRANDGDSDEFTVGITHALSNVSYGRTSGNQIPLNEWFHVALVFDGSKPTNAERLILYKNGLPLNLTFSGDIPSRTPIISADFDLGVEATTFRYPFNGKLDELRIWDFARSNEDITEDMNCHLVGDEEGIIAYYRFNEGIAGGNNGSVTTLPDLSSNEHHGELVNFTLVGNSSNWVSSSANVSDLCMPQEPCYDTFVEIDRDLLLKEINSGLILVSPNGDKWKLTVDNTGAIISTKVVVCED